MIYFLTGLGLFFGPHIFTAIRSRAPSSDLKEKLGYNLYMGGYSLLALIGLCLIVYGYGQTRGLGVLYTPPIFLQHLNSLFMLFALIFLIASQLPAGRIKATLKHPMLVAVKIWAVGHLLSNGEYNSVILFGSFLAYAVFDRIMVKRRGDMGPDPDEPVSGVFDIASILIGIGFWASLAFWLHIVLFGVSAVPGL